MDGLFPLIETAIAFSLVMLATSLVVSAFVQMLQSLFDLRSKNLLDMLHGLLRGFRSYYNDSETPAATEAPNSGEQAFAQAILGHASVRGQGSARDRIEHIDRRDLVSLVGSLASFAKGLAGNVPDDENLVRKLPLPTQWFADPHRDYRTVGNFADYVARWFDTVEATYSQRFRNKIRLLTIGVSGMLVMLMGLDGIRLARDLHASHDARKGFLDQAAEIQRAAARLGVEGAAVPTGEPDPGRDQSNKELLLEAQKLATLLDTAPGIRFGWQSSWFTKEFCAQRGICRDVPAPGWGVLFQHFLALLAGLIFSSVMLSLGAPFWVDTLGRFINLRNAVATASDERNKKEPPSLLGADGYVLAASAGPRSIRKADDTKP
jgi:hypothetical protein